MMRALQRALQGLWRSWRGGELALLALSLVLAVSIVSGIAGFSERLNLAMVDQSHQFLAADRVLKSSRPVPAAWQQSADKLGLRQAEVVRFQSMLIKGDAMQLASVKAVSDDYPLLGELQIGDRAFAEGEFVNRGPRAGEIWMDSRLFALLGLEPGDAVELGELSLRASKVLVSEPDQGGMSSLFAPRAMINLRDLAATEVVQPGSRVSYRYLFSGEEGALEAYQQGLESQLQAWHEWQDIRESQPAMAETLERAEAYLLLAASLGVALAGVAVALAARRYGERHIDQVTIMKALGASRRWILTSFLTELLILAVVATVVGASLGLLLQWGLYVSLRELLPADVPMAGYRPLLVGGVTALLCTAVFALPPILRLSRVSPLRVLRRDVESSREGLLASAALGLSGIAGLMWWYSGDVLMAGAVLLSSLGLVVLAIAVVLLLVRGAKRMAETAWSSRLRLVVAAVYRRRFANAFQVASFSLALMALATLALLRNSLIEDWQIQLSDEAPNHFLINIQEFELAPLRQFFAKHDIADAGLYPMVRGRLSHIDGQPVAEITGIDARDDNINREMNLSWAASLPEDNRIIAGRWWQGSADRGQPLPTSVEADIAEQLDLKIGSRLRFDLGGQTLDAEVTSIRSLDWSSMRPNFYFMFPPDSLRQYAGSYITSFYLPPEQKSLLSTLLRQFPTFTLIEIDGVLKQMKTVVAQLGAAIALVLALVLLCSLLVSLANIQASVDQRLQENALLRTLGASTALIRSSLLTEFMVMGVVAGLLAALGGDTTLYALQRWALDMNPRWHWSIFAVAPIFAAVVLTATGWMACRKVVVAPPLSILRS